MGRRMLDLKGQRFDKLVVLEKAGISKRKQVLWLCRCDCGTEKINIATGLKSGKIKSCGAWHYRPNYKGGLSHTKKQQKKYRLKRQLQDHPSHVFSGLKKGAISRSIPLKWTKEEFCNWYPAQPRTCYYCGISVGRVSAKGMVASGISIDRTDNDGPYSEDNCVLCCNRCNTIKGNIFTCDEMMFIGQYILKPKWQSTAKL